MRSKRSEKRLPPAEILTTINHFQQELKGRRLNGFLGLSLNDRSILFLVILLNKKVSVGYDARLKSGGSTPLSA